jgi:uncharacterized protein
VSLLFADTFYFLALLHEEDEAHHRAASLTARQPFRILTTSWILTELADGLCALHGRRLFQTTYESLKSEPAAMVLPPDAEIYDAAIDLYFRRPDKEWSLTDCTSFVVMRKYNITDALTADHHFEQAGFIALLK